MATTRSPLRKKALAPSRLLLMNLCRPYRRPMSAALVSEMMRTAIAVMAMTLGNRTTRSVAARSTYVAPLSRRPRSFCSWERSKNPKYVLSMEVTNDYKGGYWEDQGYNSFSGS